MDLRQLKYFVAVAEEGNFTRAAERVFITQSGVSAQVQQLERELGAPLLDRSGRRATLTAAGEAAIDPARDALAAARRVRDAVDAVNEVVRGRVTIGMVTACTVTPFFDALGAFGRAHPGVEVELVEDTSDLLTQRIRSGAMEVALIGCAHAMPADLDGLEIISEGLSALIPADHPLSGTDEVALRELVGHPIVALPLGTGIRTVLEESCTAAGLSHDVALQATAPSAVADLAQRGLGVGVLSTSMAAEFASDDLSVAAIDGIAIPALLGLAWTKTPSPAASALLVHLREAFGDDGGAVPPASAQG
ncbi:MAG: LysR family transcriptional regulator [Solirubrobacteraceae bacterium]|nr:LysR family transcriptional regulator [Solirubrobacteraceae bacterium]